MDEWESHGDGTPQSSMTIQSRSTLDFLFSWQSQWEQMQRTIRWRHVSVGRPTVACVRFICIQPVLRPCSERSFERTRWLCQLLRRRRCAVFECNSRLKMVLWQQKAKLRAFMKQQALHYCDFISNKARSPLRQECQCKSKISARQI